MSRGVFVVLSFCLLAACEKKEEMPAAKCVYDVPVFAEMCALAVADGEQFAHFKQNPYFNLLWENRTQEEGWEDLRKIEMEHPFLLEAMQRFQTSDGIGSPRVYPYGAYGSFSPYTLRLIGFAGDVFRRAGDLSGKRVVQIGAGYGGLCKVLHDLYAMESYTLIDLPEQLALAQKFLEGAGIAHARYVPVDQLFFEREYDVVLSDQSFSEFSRSYQEQFIEHLFPRCHFGYLQGHLFPKHFGVVALNPEELIKKLKRKLTESAVQVEEPENDRGNYLIHWQSQKGVQQNI